VSLDQAIRVEVKYFRQFFFEQARKCNCSFTPLENSSALEDDDLGGDVAPDVFFKVMDPSET